MSDDIDIDEILDEVNKVVLVQCETPRDAGWVYFIGCPETRRCKIGFTKGRPEKRLAGLQTGSASQLALIAMHPGDPGSERKLHLMFAADRVHGEWFEIGTKLQAYIARTVWVMSEINLKHGKKLEHWMVAGCELCLDRLHTMPDSLVEALGLDPE